MWNPATRVWTLRATDGTTRTVTLGALGDRPVTGDWNGDKITDLGVWTPSTATFTLRTRTAAGVVTTTAVQLGTPTDLPVTGDWDGNGVTDLGAWSPSTATYQLRPTPAADQVATVTPTRMGVARR